MILLLPSFTTLAQPVSPRINMFKYSPNQQYVAIYQVINPECGIGSAEILVVNVATDETIYMFPGHGCDGYVVWSPTGRFLASTGIDGSINVWDTAIGTLSQQFILTWHGVSSLSWRADEAFMVANIGNCTTCFEMYSLATGVKTTIGTIENAGSVAWHPSNNNEIAVSEQDGVIRVYSASGEFIREMGEFNSYGLGWSPNGLYIVTFESAKALIIDSTTGAILHELIVPPLEEYDGFRDLSWSDDNRIIALTTDKFLGVWNVSTGELIYQDTSDYPNYIDIRSVGNQYALSRSVVTTLGYQEVSLPLLPTLIDDCWQTRR